MAICFLYPLLYSGMYAGDAEIHLVYGENASKGCFFCFNPGEPSSGVTSPGWMLIIAMMFSYMIVTGPTEELFSRGFLQDQTARAFDLKFAILFSSVLFASGHLPISILVYRLSFMTIV